MLAQALQVCTWHIMTAPNGGHDLSISCSLQFNFDDDHVFTCIGTSGKEPLALPSPMLEPLQPAPSASAAPWASSALAAAEEEAPIEVDPEAFFTAVRSFMQQQFGGSSGQQQQGGGPPQQQ